MPIDKRQTDIKASDPVYETPELTAEDAAKACLAILGKLPAKEAIKSLGSVTQAIRKATGKNEIVPLPN